MIFSRNQDVRAPETTQGPRHITPGDKNRQNQTLLAVMLNDKPVVCCFLVSNVSLSKFFC